jgi:hypothetical protein
VKPEKMKMSRALPCMILINIYIDVGRKDELERNLFHTWRATLGAKI